MPSDPEIIDLGRLDRIETGLRQVLQVLDDLREREASRARFVTLKEATRLFGIAPRTLRQYIRGYAPGGKMLVAVDEIELFIRAAAVDRDRDLDAIAEEAVMEVSKR